MGRVRLHMSLDFSAYSLETFILDNIEPNSMIATDGWKSYNIIESNPYGHDKTKQSTTKDNNKLYGVHLITTLVKRLIQGTFQGRLEPKYLQNYLDEFTFRFNRRKSKSVGKKFMRIIQQAVNSAKVTGKEIMWDMDPISEYYAT